MRSFLCLLLVALATCFAFVLPVSCYSTTAAIAQPHMSPMGRSTVLRPGPPPDAANATADDEDIPDWAGLTMVFVGIAPFAVLFFYFRRNAAHQDRRARDATRAIEPLPDYTQSELEALREIETAIANTATGGEQQ